MTEATMASYSETTSELGYYWSRVQYCPDSNRGDLFTVGVALFDAVRQKFLLRLVGNTAVLNKMLGSAGHSQLRAGELEAMCSPIERLLNKFAGTSWSVESLSKATYFIGLQTKVGLTPPLGVYVEDPFRLDITLADVFESTLGEVVSKAKSGRRSISKEATRIVSTIERLNPTAAKKGLITKPRVTIPNYGNKKVSAAFMYRNGTLRLNQVIDLKQGEEERELTEKSSALMGDAHLVSRHAISSEALSNPTIAVLDLIFARPLPEGGVFRRFESDFRDLSEKSKIIVANDRELAAIAAAMQPDI